MKTARSTTSALAALAPRGRSGVRARASSGRPSSSGRLPPSPAAAEQLRPPVVDPDLSPPRPGEAVTVLSAPSGTRSRWNGMPRPSGTSTGMDLPTSRWTSARWKRTRPRSTIRGELDGAGLRRVHGSAKAPTAPRVQPRAACWPSSTVSGPRAAGAIPAARQSYLVKGAWKGLGSDVPAIATRDWTRPPSARSATSWPVRARRVRSRTDGRALPCRNAEAARLRVVARQPPTDAPPGRSPCHRRPKCAMIPT